MKIIPYHKLLKEDFDVINGELNLNTKNGGIKSKFGKDKHYTPYKTKIEGTDIITYSVYLAGSENSSDILKAIKSMNFKDESSDKFIKRTSIYINRILRNNQIDIIVSPKSSSHLVKTLLNELETRSNYHILSDTFVKIKNLNNLTIDTEHPKMTNELKTVLSKMKEKSVSKNNFSMKSIPPKYRKFFKGLFEIENVEMIKKFQNKNVVIFDDVLTSGQTIKQINDLLFSYGAKKVIGITIFKSAK